MKISKVGFILAAIAIPEACRALSIVLVKNNSDYKGKLASFYGSFLSSKADISAALFTLSIGSSMICYKAITSKTPLSCCMAIAVCAIQDVISCSRDNGTRSFN